jgi:hypothetical protein
MKRIEKYIPLAINVVDDLILKEQNIVAPEWDNCVANFGAAIRQMGLLTAVTAFSQESDRSKVSKKALMHYLLRIIKVADGKMCDINDDLMRIVQQRPHDKLLKRQITDAAIAMKLALRLFIDNPDNLLTTEETEDDDE